MGDRKPTDVSPAVPPPRLLEAVHTGDCVAFVGAGFSASSLPGWADLLRELAREAPATTQQQCDALLVKNPHLEPGKPLTLRVSLATVRLGVWSKKERSPFDKKGGVQLNERMVRPWSIISGAPAD